MKISNTDEGEMVYRSPVWLMASIPDGIAREDGNLTEIFLSDCGGLALVK